jgi:hypothetical protein
MGILLKRCLLVGFVASLGLQVLSAVITAWYPYRDVPIAPRPIFLYLLLPGWLAAGYPSPYRWWNAAIAIAVNSGSYSLILFGVLIIWKRLRR